MSVPTISIDNQQRLQFESDLSAWWCTALGLSRLGLDADLFQQGCNPSRMQWFVDHVRHSFHVEVAPSELYEARTIAKLADLIEIRRASLDTTCILPIRPEGSGQPLFLIHGVGGNLLGFVSLVRALRPDQPVYGIQAQALETRGPLLVELEAMASHYIREMRRFQPNGPYAFLGLSFGGLVAYEMAQQLRAAGETVSLLGMLDTWQPGYREWLGRKMPWHHRALGRLSVVRSNTRKLSVRQTIRYCIGRAKTASLRWLFARISNRPGVTLPGSMRRVREINLIAGSRYKVRPYAGCVTLFRASDDVASLPDDLGWGGFARGGVEMVRLPGDHGQVIAEPTVAVLAEALTARLTRVESAPFPSREERTEFDLIDPESDPALSFSAAPGLEVVFPGVILQSQRLPGAAD